MKPTQAARVQVLVAEDGSILAGVLREGTPNISDAASVLADDEGPQIELAPQDGQRVAEIEVPEDLLGEDGVDLQGLLSYRLADGSEGKLTR